MSEIVTLQEFLAESEICRVWWCGVGSPSGVEFVLDTDTECDEDYCDGQMLLDLIPDGAMNLKGEVNTESDGELCWEVVSMTNNNIYDSMKNTIYNIKVWSDNRRFDFWTDGGDYDSIVAESLSEAADIASRKITKQQWSDGAWGIVRDALTSEQMDVPSR